MDKISIEERLIEIFRSKLYRDITKCNNIWKESIFGKNIALLPSEAFFLLHEIEDEFEISFTDDVVFDRKFDKLKDILDCIQNKTELINE